MVDIQQMICISTAHISENTAGILNDNANGIRKYAGIDVYKKDQFGWFIYIDKSAVRRDNPAPDDLKHVIQFALDHNCSVLCLDNDYEPLPYLQTYDW